MTGEKDVFELLVNYNRVKKIYMNRSRDMACKIQDIF